MTLLRRPMKVTFVRSLLGSDGTWQTQTWHEFCQTDQHRHIASRMRGRPIRLLHEEVHDMRATRHPISRVLRFAGIGLMLAGHGIGVGRRALRISERLDRPVSLGPTGL